MRDDILSSVREAPISYFVYSSLSYYGARRGGEIPGTWFVNALAPIGHSEAAVRQVLYRMERDKELWSRKDGRTKYYRATPYAQAEVDAGLHKIFGDADPRWDGEWTLVHFQFDAAHRAERDRVRSILGVEGFAPLGPGLFIHPRDRVGGVLGAVSSLGVDRHLEVFRAAKVGGEDAAAFVARLWNLGELARGYRAFVRRFDPLAARAKAEIADRDAFVLRFAVVFSFLRVAWTDPELPGAMLPSPWPGRRARDLARSLYETLLPGALAHADSILRDNTDDTAQRTHRTIAHDTTAAGGARRRRRALPPRHRGGRSEAGH